MINLDENVTSEMNRYLDGTTIEEILERNKKMFHFQVMFNATQMEQGIDVLELIVRGYNCLKRHGFNTLSDLVNGVETKEDATSKKQLLRVRNLGRKSAEEILMKLFYYQFQVLSDERKKAYMQRIVEANL